jgi:hypothetical protein
MDMSQPTDAELDDYPHVFFTSDIPWDPSILDNKFNASDIELLKDDDISPAYKHNTLNDYGELIQYQLDKHTIILVTFMLLFIMLILLQCITPLL